VPEARANLVARRTSEDTEGEVQRVLGKLEASGRSNLILSLLANSTTGFRPFVLMSNALLTRSALPPPVRECAILAIAAAQANSYEWQEHVLWAREVGLTDEQIAAIEAGQDDSSAEFTDEMRLAMRVARRLGSARWVEDDDWDEMCSCWGEATALDVCMVAAWWGGFVPVMTKALRLVP
jgi:4-carboxymuconolactone decarboxylase